LWPSDYISVNNASAAKWYLHDFGLMRRARSWPGQAGPRACDTGNRPPPHGWQLVPGSASPRGTSSRIGASSG